MKKRRVVITGIGIITPLGIGLETFWTDVLAGKSGVDRCSILVKSDCPWKIAGEVRDFRPEDWLTRKDVKRMDRFTQFGLVTSHMAITDAKLNLAQEDCTRIGLALGTAYSGWGFAAQEYDAYKTKGFDAMSAYTSIAVFTGSCGGQISLHLGLHASSLTIATGCDCASAAIAQAAEMIVSNDVDIMLAGGAEAPIQPIVVAAVGTSHAMSSRNSEPACASRPFDRKRDGFVMSEGACVLVVEELEHALRRRAHIYAELTGWASTCDGYHMCQPDPDGTQAVRGFRLALARAGIRPDKVDYVNAHGTSTPLGDKAETVVLKSVFGENAYNIPISSIKSSLGHTQGACGSIELAACCLAIRDNVLPPTINYEYPDPECDLDFVPNVARHRRVDIAVSNSLGFGGRNTALVVERYRDKQAHGLNGRSETHENGSAVN